MYLNLKSLKHYQSVLEKLSKKIAYGDTLVEFHMFSIISLPMILIWLHFLFLIDWKYILFNASNRCLIHHTESCSFNSFDFKAGINKQLSCYCDNVYKYKGSLKLVVVHLF